MGKSGTTKQRRSASKTANDSVNSRHSTRVRKNQERSRRSNNLMRSDTMMEAIAITGGKCGDMGKRNRQKPARLDMSVYANPKASKIASIPKFNPNPARRVSKPAQPRASTSKTRKPVSKLQSDAKSKPTRILLPHEQRRLTPKEATSRPATFREPPTVFKDVPTQKKYQRSKKVVLEEPPPSVPDFYHRRDLVQEAAAPPMAPPTPPAPRREMAPPTSPAPVTNKSIMKKKKDRGRSKTRKSTTFAVRNSRDSEKQSAPKVIAAQVTTSNQANKRNDAAFTDIKSNSSRFTTAPMGRKKQRQTSPAQKRTDDKSSTISRFGTFKPSNKTKDSNKPPTISENTPPAPEVGFESRGVLLAEVPEPPTVFQDTRIAQPSTSTMPTAPRRVPMTASTVSRFATSNFAQNSTSSNGNPDKPSSGKSSGVGTGSSLSRFSTFRPPAVRRPVQPTQNLTPVTEAPQAVPGPGPVLTSAHLNAHSRNSSANQSSAAYDSRSVVTAFTELKTDAAVTNEDYFKQFNASKGTFYYLSPTMNYFEVNGKILLGRSKMVPPMPIRVAKLKMFKGDLRVFIESQARDEQGRAKQTISKTVTQGKIFKIDEKRVNNYMAKGFSHVSFEAISEWACYQITN